MAVSSESKRLVNSVGEVKEGGGGGDWRSLLIILIAPVIGGFVLGIGYGNLGGVLDDDNFSSYYSSPSTVTTELIAATTQAGSMFGCVVGGYSVDRLGRKVCSVLASTIVVSGCFLSSLPFFFSSNQLSIGYLFAGRILLGLGGTDEWDDAMREWMIR